MKFLLSNFVEIINFILESAVPLCVPL